MFDPVSHLWLRDKSVSVTQLKPSVRANCGSAKAFNCFSVSVRRKRGIQADCTVCSQQYFCRNINIYKPDQIPGSDKAPTAVNRV